MTTAQSTQDPPTLVRPDSPEWDDARRAWNLAVDQRPEAVAMPRDSEEVAAAVRWAADAGLRIAVQATGHGASARPDLEGALLINMSGLRGVSVDPEARTARAEAGAIWQDVLDRSVPHGLTALHGSAHDVGVAGYTLGGGIGWLARSHGLACNAVRAIELVTPEGEMLRADASNQADLFWALRGGGGGYGVVTALEFDLFPLTEAYAGWLMWPWERAQEVLETWSSLCDGLPEEITSVGRLLQLFPGLPDVPPPLEGAKLVVIEACCQCTRERADELLAPLRALEPMMDTFDMVPAAGLTRLHQDPPVPVPGIADGGLLDDFGPQAVRSLLSAVGPDSGTNILSTEIRHLEGALGRAPEGAGALARLDGRFALFGVGIPLDPQMGAALPGDIDRLLATMAPHGFGRRYLNFAERPTDAGGAFPADARTRLRTVRRAVDPEGRLAPNHDSGAPPID